jgi:hypothetical protein
LTIVRRGNINIRKGEKSANAAEFGSPPSCSALTAQPGFVLAGRNLREVEAREEQVGQMAGLTWIGMLGVILVGTAVFGWYTRPRPA